MPTPAQKKFRKEMKELKNHNNLKEDFRVTRKRPTIVRKISIISIIFLLWNSFAIYTWISPFFKAKQIDSFIPNQNVVKSQFIGGNIKNKNNEVIDYFKKIEVINKELASTITKINNSPTGNIYNKNDILNDGNKLDTLKDYIKTENQDFILLEYSYLKLINTTKIALDNLYNDRAIYLGITNLEEDWYITGEDIKSEMIRILDKNEIKYKVNDDGTMTYQY